MSSRQSGWKLRTCRMIALATAMSFPGCSPKVQIPGSVEVESCDPGEAAAVAGLKAGDVVQMGASFRIVAL